MKNPLVSIIVPTKNSASTLAACLRSIKDQTYPHIELIVVDNHSTDNTVDIARRFTDKVYLHGPERSAQRNYGAKKSKGVYLLFIDSDMELSKNVVKSCVDKIGESPNFVGVIIPEESFGEGFWAQCKKLEKSFYVGNDAIEATRFFKRGVFEKVGGYDETLISAEDWDLSQRIEALGKLDRIKELIFHNEGKINLLKTVKKKFYYAQQFRHYSGKNQPKNKLSNQTGILNRYQLFFSQPSKLLSNPATSAGMLLMKTFEFTSGAMGYLTSKPKYEQPA